MSTLSIRSQETAPGFAVLPSVTMDPFGVAPLAGLVTFETNEPTQATLRVSSLFDEWTVEFPEPRTDHALPILGLKPESLYDLQITVINDRGERAVFDQGLAAVTGPLPSDFPKIEVFSNPDLMEPGYTLLDSPVFTFEQQDYFMIVDEVGDVIYYGLNTVQDGRQLSSGEPDDFDNGSILYLDWRSGDRAIVYNLLGDTERQIVLDELNDLAPIHHEVFPTAQGTFLTSGWEAVEVEGFPTSEEDPTPRLDPLVIMDNPVIEFDVDGTILNTWRLIDLIDPSRVAYDSFGVFFGTEGPDWVHLNAVIEEPDGDIIISLRHQDALVNFSRDGTLNWILAPHDNWSDEYLPYLLTPVGENFEWSYHIHAPMITNTGDILLFDNGNYRASPYDGTEPLSDSENYSRAVIYRVHEESMEVEQVWEYGASISEKFFSGFISDADELPLSGNILINSGATLFLGGESSASLGKGPFHTRIVEVNRDTSQVVFEMAVSSPTRGVGTYRAERIGSLYSSEVVTTPIDKALDDVFIGTEEADILSGDFDSDILRGLGGDDTMTGYGGLDYMIGDAGNDLFVGGDGIDIVDYSSDPALVFVNPMFGTAVNVNAGFAHLPISPPIHLVIPDDEITVSDGYGDVDTVREVEQLIATEFDDMIAANVQLIDARDGNDLVAAGDAANRILGGAGDDILMGGAGDDVLVGGQGNDVLNGGAGFDNADYTSSPQSLSVTLGSGVGNAAADGFGTADTLTFIEGIMGSAFDDVLVGDTNDNFIDGQAGADIIAGKGGNDFLLGGAGDDFIVGGSGTDIIEGGAGIDYLTGNDDFGIVHDGETDIFRYSGIVGASSDEFDIVDFDPTPPEEGGDLLDFSQLLADVPAASLFAQPDGGGNSVIGVVNGESFAALVWVMAVDDPNAILDDNVLMEGDIALL